jgi:integrase
LKLAVDGIPVKPRAKEREHGLGAVRVDRLDARTMGAWRRRLPEGSAWHAHKALRQVLSFAVRAKLTSENVAQLVPNPRAEAARSSDVRRVGRARPARRRAPPARASLPMIARSPRSCTPARASLPILVAGTGLRPEEWLALEWRDVHLKLGVLHVRRVYTNGRVKDYGKQDRSRRRLPLRRKAVDAFRAGPQGFGPSLLYPAEKGGYLNLHAWRRNEWYPALDAAGLPRLVPYSMRHSFASFAITAGVSLLYLARLMNSSVEQIDKTYGHLLPDSEEYLRGLVDNYDTTTTTHEAMNG